MCSDRLMLKMSLVPPTRRPRAYHRVNPYPGARRQNETEMFSDHDETSLSIAAVSAPSSACSMLAVQQQKRLCCQFVDVSVARRGCHTLTQHPFCVPWYLCTYRRDFNEICHKYSSCECELLKRF